MPFGLANVRGVNRAIPGGISKQHAHWKVDVVRINSVAYIGQVNRESARGVCDIVKIDSDDMLCWRRPTALAQSQFNQDRGWCKCFFHYCVKTFSRLHVNAWLAHAHANLDAAVAAAYGWAADLSDEGVLERLLALNLERAGEEKRVTKAASRKRSSRAKTADEMI